MTMLGELYANGSASSATTGRPRTGIARRDLGDREAMFALGMMRLSGRGGSARIEKKAPNGWRRPRNSATRKPPTISALLYLEGQIFPQDLKRAAELFRGLQPMPETPKRNTRSQLSIKRARA